MGGIASEQQSRHSFLTRLSEGLHSAHELLRIMAGELAQAKNEHALLMGIAEFEYEIKDGRLYHPVYKIYFDDLIDPPLHRRDESYVPLKEHVKENLRELQRLICSGSEFHLTLSSPCEDFKAEKSPKGQIYSMRRVGDKVLVACTDHSADTKQMEKERQKTYGDEPLFGNTTNGGGIARSKRTTAPTKQEMVNVMRETGNEDLARQYEAAIFLGDNISPEKYMDTLIEKEMEAVKKHLEDLGIDINKEPEKALEECFNLIEPQLQTIRKEVCEAYERLKLDKGDLKVQQHEVFSPSEHSLSRFNEPAELTRQGIGSSPNIPGEQQRYSTVIDLASFRENPLYRFMKQHEYASRANIKLVHGQAVSVVNGPALYSANQIHEQLRRNAGSISLKSANFSSNRTQLVHLNYRYVSTNSERELMNGTYNSAPSHIGTNLQSKGKTNYTARNEIESEILARSSVSAGKTISYLQQIAKIRIDFQYRLGRLEKQLSIQMKLSKPGMPILERRTQFLKKQITNLTGILNQNSKLQVKLLRQLIPQIGINNFTSSLSKSDRQILLKIVNMRIVRSIERVLSIKKQLEGIKRLRTSLTSQSAIRRLLKHQNILLKRIALLEKRIAGLRLKKLLLMTGVNKSTNHDRLLIARMQYAMKRKRLELFADGQLQNLMKARRLLIVVRSSIREMLNGLLKSPKFELSQMHKDLLLKRLNSLIQLLSGQKREALMEIRLKRLIEIQALLREDRELSVRLLGELLELLSEEMEDNQTAKVRRKKRINLKSADKKQTRARTMMKRKSDLNRKIVPALADNSSFHNKVINSRTGKAISASSNGPSGSLDTVTMRENDSSGKDS